MRTLREGNPNSQAKARITGVTTYRGSVYSTRYFFDSVAFRLSKQPMPIFPKATWRARWQCLRMSSVHSTSVPSETHAGAMHVTPIIHQSTSSTRKYCSTASQRIGQRIACSITQRHLAKSRTYGRGNRCQKNHTPHSGFTFHARRTRSTSKRA